MSPIRPRDILARNIRRQIDHDTPKGSKASVRGWALGKGLEVKLVERLVKNSHAVTLDSLQTVAEACGLQAWHLLLENFAPGESLDAPVTEEDRKMLRKLRRLLDEDDGA
jgi:hypothetical protein